VRVKFLIFAVIFASAFAFAAEDIGVNEDRMIKPHTNNFTISALLENFDYNENVMTEKGPLIGVLLDFAHELDGRFSVQTDVEAATGRTDYTGSDWQGSSVTTQNQFLVAEASAHLLGEINPESACVVSPMLALGYHYTYQDKEAAGTYRREYDYGYIGPAIQFKFPFKDRSSLVLVAEYDSLEYGSNTSHLSDASHYPDVTMSFQDGGAVRISAEYNFIVNNLPDPEQKWRLLFSYVAWNIGSSQTADISPTKYVVEPTNQTYLTSLSLGYTFQ
jgi:hypothetical protein